MHVEPPLLVLPNAWDVASAKAFASVPGCRALATTSAAVARSLGWEDGERAPRDEMVEAARRIAAAVDLPVTADLERGYGDPVGTARAAWAAGLVGINFEDSTGAGLVPIDEQAAAIAAIREAVPELVVNARVDVFLRIGGDVDEAVERANAYLAAGADCVVPDPLPARLDRRACAPDRRADERDRRPGRARPGRAAGARVARLTWGGGPGGGRLRRGGPRGGGSRGWALRCGG